MFAPELVCPRTRAVVSRRARRTYTQALTIIRRIFWPTFLMERRFAYLPFVEMFRARSQTRPCMRLCFVDVFVMPLAQDHCRAHQLHAWRWVHLPADPPPSQTQRRANAMTHRCYDKAARLRRLRDISGPTKPENEKATRCCVLVLARHIKSCGPVPHIRETRERVHPPPPSNHQASALA